jgi:hypothetical protein
MSILEFISALVKALSWPLGVVATAALFRREIAQKFEALEKLDTPMGFAAHFSREVSEISENSEGVSIYGRGEASGPPPEVTALPSLAIDHPNSAVEAAWSALETQLRQSAQSIGVVSDGPVATVVDGLTRRGSIDGDAGKLITDLHRVRHSIKDAKEVPREAASQYVGLAQKAREALVDAK